jgi:hypothetical protein
VSAEAEDPLPPKVIFDPYGPRIHSGRDRRTIAKHKKQMEVLGAVIPLLEASPKLPPRAETPACYLLKEAGVEPLPNVVNMQGQAMEMARFERLAIPISGIVSIHPASQQRTAG